MIPSDRVDVLELGLDALSRYQRATGARGRFIALYLGLRRMDIARLGSASATPAGEIEQHLDLMFTKTQREEPLVVLTAPFGGSTSPTRPYSARTGVVAPGNKYPTNTWRNNFAIQKGVGCPAEAQVIADLLDKPAVRLACPHMAVSPEDSHVCELAATAYRGEEHSIWLRMLPDGYQCVDLDLPTVYTQYLFPNEVPIPIFPLIAVLYGMAPAGAYPSRPIVGIPDFATDFGFELDRCGDLFNCDPEGDLNAQVLALSASAGSGSVSSPQSRFVPRVRRGERRPATGPGNPLPPEADPVELNNGVGAERAVAEQLFTLGWSVSYRGNQQLVGYDLEATKDGLSLYVEVKSSVGFTTPELTESEWQAASELSDQFVLAVVDFFGSDQQSVWFVRDPAGVVTPTEVVVTRYRLPRAALAELKTEADFL